MARLSATAALLFLLLSPLAVAHCRPLEEASATDAESAAAVEVSDENGPPNPTLPAEAGAAEVVLPADQQQHGFLRLPSHRFHRHRPCRHGHGLFHRHLWWARHHGAFGDAPRLFQRHIEVPRHLSVFGESREVKAVAEPDPDHSLPDSDGEGEMARMEPSFGDADGAHEAAHHEDDEGAAVRAWKREMLRRWFQFHHHGMRLHRHHYKEGHEQREEAAEGLKRFHHHRHDEDEEKNRMMRKRFRHAEHDDDSDSDDEDDEVEEMVRRFRKAIMRRRFGHVRRFHHHHYVHRHAEEAEKADTQEDGGVVSWIKGLMNRF